jgi:glycosyltransferase involved in cell wall biosynthesis
MFGRPRELTPLEDRGPLRVMFVITSMPVGGAETMLVEIIRRLDRSRFLPELCCLKYFDPLGEVLAEEIPAFTGLLSHKYDFRVLPRLVRLIKQRRIDAVVTVGTGGDKMFWGRLAARIAGVRVICSALHSTGLPDHVEFSNRLLAPITDAFIAVAEPHGEYLAKHEGCPRDKVAVIPNGVDIERFGPGWPSEQLRQELGIANGTPTAGIIAALRPEKDHELFLRAASLVHQQIPEARFLIVGDGPRRRVLEDMAKELAIEEAVLFLGTRDDVTDILRLLDVVLLTSKMEANPVSIIEAMACEKPVVATKVGSVGETVIEGTSGYLISREADEFSMAEQFAARTVELMRNTSQAEAMGRAGRENVISNWSIERTIEGYEELISGIYASKQVETGPPRVGQRDVLYR